MVFSSFLPMFSLQKCPHFPHPQGPSISPLSKMPAAGAPPCRRGRPDSAWSAWPGVAGPRRPCDLKDERDDPHLSMSSKVELSNIIKPSQTQFLISPDLLWSTDIQLIYEFFFDFLLMVILGVYLPTCWTLTNQDTFGYAWIFRATVSQDLGSKMDRNTATKRRGVKSQPQRNIVEDPAFTSQTCI